MPLNPDPYSWNDSLRGDFLWTKTNFGEAVPDVMTPATWTVFSLYEEEVVPFPLPGDYPAIGVVGGRLYFNFGLVASVAMALGFSAERLAEEGAALFGPLPAGVEIPRLPISRWTILRHIIGPVFRQRRRIVQARKELDGFLAGALAAHDRAVQAIDDGATPQNLATIWEEHLQPLLRRTCLMLKIATDASSDPTRALKKKLTKLLDEESATALMVDFSTESETLASVQPLLGLAQVTRGELSREEYSRRFGHRGPHEIELSYPRPADDPDWMNSQLEQLKGHDPLELLAEQRARRSAARDDLRRRLPNRLSAIEKELDGVAAGARLREQTRSECVRLFGVGRNFVQKAAAFTGMRDDAFFLTLPELARLLGGEQDLADFIPARREMYERLRVLPPYPAIIRGRFDPFAWVENPQRRLDFYDGSQPADLSPPTGDILAGTGGSAGVAEGRVRVLTDPKESATFQAGEILVAHITNVGWTPLFPRAGAVVTDVGAVLSHAAIVARELGIPAVVGTGDATLRLHTGDWVRVDGLAGTVEKMTR